MKCLKQFLVLNKFDSIQRIYIKIIRFSMVIKTSTHKIISLSLLIFTTLFIIYYPSSIFQIFSDQKSTIIVKLNSLLTKMQSLHQDLKFKDHQRHESSKNKSQKYFQLIDAQNSAKRTFDQIPQFQVYDIINVEQILDLPIYQRVPEVIFLSILHKYEQEGHQYKILEQKVNKIGQKVNKVIDRSGLARLEIRLISIKENMFGSQIRDKIVSAKTEINYGREIGQAVLNSRVMGNCKYTHLKCQQYSVYLLHSRDQSDSESIEVGGIYFVDEREYQRAIYNILLIDRFFSFASPLQAWVRYLHIRNTIHIKAEISHLLNLLSTNQKYHPNLTAIDTYISKTLTFIQSSCEAPLPADAFSLKQLNQLDLFPSQYKLGVYLPLILLFTIFPCASVIQFNSL